MNIYREYTDRELTALIKLGDKFAYTEIYDRYIWVLLEHAYNKLRNREESKDVVQDAFTLLWHRREILNDQYNISGFLYSIVIKKILNIFAHRKIQDKYTFSMEQFAWNGSQNFSDHLIREQQLKAMIEKEIAALPSKMREVFELSRKSHLNHKQIAGQLSISEQTVSKQVSNALKILKIKFGAGVCLLLLLN